MKKTVENRGGSPSRPVCVGQTRKGTPCKGWAASGSEFCSRHQDQVATDRLTEEEMVSILESIARTGGDTARIQAIKALQSMRDTAPEQPADDWTEIYGHDNVTPISSARKAG